MEGGFDTKNKGTFTWSDAWVLASIAVGGGLKGCELKDVIAAGDLINRAIFNGDELRSGLTKLVNAGYVLHAGGFYVIAGDARAAVEEEIEEGATSYGVMQFFEDFLEVDPYADPERMPQEECPLDSLNDTDIVVAINAYRNEFAALWRELQQIDHNTLPERAIRLLEEAAQKAKD
jgi:hypothetical protein